MSRIGKSKVKARRSATLQKLEEGAREILENGQIEVLDKSLYRVSSMSSDAHYEVSYTAGLWGCGCKYYTSGHTQCKHICAVRAMIVARETVAEAIKTEVNIPKIQCRKCESTNLSVTTTYKSKSGTRPVYRCAERKHRFVYRPGFMYRQYSDDTITDVLIDAAAGHPPGRIIERLAKNGIKISERTIQRWTVEYSELMERITKTLHYNLGDKWSLDEVFIKNYPTNSGIKKSTKKKSDDYYVFAALDNLTGLILSSEVEKNKFGYDGTSLLLKAMMLAQGTPRVVIADKLNGFKTGFANSVQSENPDAVLVADAGINGKHVNNNKRERLNGELKDCLRRARGFRSEFPGLVRLTILYHNFIHKSRRGGITPAEAAGVFVAGPDIFKTLIQNAALMAT